jgi:hypothetical protein
MDFAVYAPTGVTTNRNAVKIQHIRMAKKSEPGSIGNTYSRKMFFCGEPSRGAAIKLRLRRTLRRLKRYCT